MGGARTWGTRDSKHVAKFGAKNKRQITMTTFSNATGEGLAFQVIFTGLTRRSLSPLNDSQRQCINFGWHIALPIVGLHLPLARSLFKKSWSLIDIVKLRNYASSQVKKHSLIPQVKDLHVTL
jgi:hypothetical protein